MYTRSCPLKSEAAFLPEARLFAIHVKLLAAHVAAKSVRHLVPQPIGKIRPRRANGLVAPDTGADLALLR